MGGSRLIHLGLALAALAVSAQVATAATPEQIRDCVERNLVRYSDPETAVAAQYADIETACIAALSGSGISAEFVGDEQANPSSPSNAPADTPNPAPNEQPAPDGGTAPEAPPAQPPPDRSPGPAPGESAEALVPQAVAGVDGRPASPLPSGIDGVPAPLGLVLAGAAALIGGAVVLSMRRRKN